MRQKVTWMKKYEGVELAALPRLAATLLKERGVTRRVWCLHGDLGSGKTTLVKAFCKALGVKERVKSPTYQVMCQYALGAEQVYHFDLYRVKEGELDELGFWACVAAESYCFVEWANEVEKMLHVPFTAIDIAYEEGNKRTLVVRGVSVTS